MRDAGLLPDLILCSSAQRTRETLACILPFFSHDCAVQITGDLYDAPEENYRDAICTHGKQASSLLVIGHNPAIHSIALDLIATGDPDLIAHAGDKYPTGGLCVIDFEMEYWSQLMPGSGRIMAFTKPRDLEEPFDQPPYGPNDASPQQD